MIDRIDPVIADGCRAEPAILKAAPQAAPTSRFENPLSADSLR
jgi:hypothetical protein